MKIAVVGTGIAGMACGHYLKNFADIFFYEKNDYAGGHTNTITIKSTVDSRQSTVQNQQLLNNPNSHVEVVPPLSTVDRRLTTDIHIDTGFMVFNHITYPYLKNLFEELNVATYPTDMSFSVNYVPDKLEYSGSGLNGLFAQRKNILNPRHIKMLLKIARFNDESIKILNDTAFANYTLEQYIAEKEFGNDMLWRYLIPMSAAVWSTPMEKMLDFPAQTLISFFYNHGFLGLHTQHQWYTVEGGSRTYRDKIMSNFKDRLYLNDPVTRIIRAGDKVTLITVSGKSSEYDKVIVACHADEALAMLDAPTDDEKRLLGKFRYEENTAVLHTDERVMPETKRVWSSWNTRVEKISGVMKTSCTYWMNSLQRLAGNTNYFVTLNYPGIIDEKKIIKTIKYTHPLFDVEAVKAQKELPILNGNGQIYYCGSYFKYGFHEDALVSAFRLCRRINPALSKGVKKN